MIVPDVNLLLYAYNSSAPEHSRARAWLESCLTATHPFGLTHGVVLGFLRIATHRRIFPSPMSTGEATAHIRSWLERPMVCVLEPTPDHLPRLLAMAEKIGAGASLITDTDIAVHALAHDGVVHTTDTDFLRFPGVRWHNPLTGASGKGLAQRS